MVIDGDIVVFKRKKQDLENEISRVFPMVDNSYDYLLHIKTIEYTEERVKALFGEWNKLREEVCLIEATGYFEMWETDIKKL
jgi:DNA topoisomerase-2